MTRDLFSSRKGFYPLFTTLGLVLVLMVVATVIDWNSQEIRDFDSHVDRLSWLRINHAVNNVRTLASNSLKDLFYDAVVEIGKIERGDTNKYLNYSKEEGWNKIVLDLSEQVSKEFKDSLPKLADYSDGIQSTFIFEEGINITIGEITAESLSVQQTESGIVAVAQLPFTVTNRYQGWEASLFESNITIPLNVRLKDIYERAWEFNNNYENTVTWSFTAAIYTRAYLAAYTAKSGPFLKEGHYDFDPIATILFGDYDEIKAFSSDMGSIVDLGAVPAATWLTEWTYLSEPSFLPAGFDMSSEDFDLAQQAISGNYRMGEIEETLCENLSGQNLEDCEIVYDVEKLEERVDLLYIEKERYEDIVDDIKDWVDDYDTTAYDKCKKEDTCDDNYDQCMDRADGDNDREDRCEDKYDECEDKYEGYGGKRAECRYDELKKLFGGAGACDDFREEATEIINELVLFFEEEQTQACENTLNNVRKETDNLRDIDDEITDNFDENEEGYGFDEVDDFCDVPIENFEELVEILDNELDERELGDSNCENNRITGVCITENDCGDSGDCDVNCQYPSCPSGSSGIYSCVGDLKTGSFDVETCEVCTERSDGSEQCSDKTDWIDECTCRCQPSIELLKEINTNVGRLYGYLKKTQEAISSTYDNFKTQLDRRKNSDKLAEMSEDLNINEMGYDVFSRIEPIYVKYDTGSGIYCYNYPTFEDRDNGVCGDAAESAILYTVQVAAASLATFFSGGATAKLLEYALKFFPVIFETEAKYTLTETLIDDGNRIMLTNIAKEGAELYTYAPFEFEIYKEREFTVGSGTLGRVIVYLYLEKVPLQRVMDGLVSGCEGQTCH
jgi:hypothetical protein